MEEDEEMIIFVVVEVEEEEADVVDIINPDIAENHIFPTKIQQILIKNTTKTATITTATTIADTADQNPS